MKLGAATARFALLVSCCLMMATPAQARFWQCVTFAREVSSVQLFGNAHTWWAQAAGTYERGHRPAVGAVMSFKSHGKMRLGHVAMVSRVVSDREVLLTHANWSRRGGVERDVRAVDVSAAGDWSEVKVWFGPIGGLGTSSYPVNGFIYPKGMSEADAIAPVTVAGNGGRDTIVAVND
ncbi:CHAP domain-containing protein [Sphingomonas sp. FW199]|uniref:CHAP domain-containing protein n=1 Tax=Sphingomonas sp. FW199 TaxID=3400217 RepID=UPI003CE9BA1A